MPIQRQWIPAIVGLALLLGGPVGRSADPTRDATDRQPSPTNRTAPEIPLHHQLNHLRRQLPPCPAQDGDSATTKTASASGRFAAAGISRRVRLCCCVMNIRSVRRPWRPYRYRIGTRTSSRPGELIAFAKSWKTLRRDWRFVTAGAAPGVHYYAAVPANICACVVHINIDDPADFKNTRPVVERIIASLGPTKK